MPASPPLHPADVDVPSFTLLQTAHQVVSAHLSISDFLTIWRTTSQQIARSLLSGRGSRVENFGTFTFNSRNEPTFLADNGFLQTIRTKQRNGQPVQAQTVSNSKVNIAAVSKEVGQPSRLVKKVVDTVIETLTSYIREGCTASLSFQPLGQFVSQPEVVFRYSKEFDRRMENSMSGNGGENRDKVLKKLNASKRPVVEPATARASTESGTHSTSRRRAATPDRFSNDNGNNVFPPAPPSPASSSRHSSISNNKYNRNSSNNIFPPPPSTATPPRLSKSAQLRQRAQQLKQSNPSRPVANPPDPRTLASNARIAELEATVEMIRNKILVRSGPLGIRSIALLLKCCDEDDSGNLSVEEMKGCFIDLGIRISPQNLQDVFTYFDKDSSGTVEFDEFMNGVRGSMSERRVQAVEQAFEHVDESEDGQLSLSELRKKYHADTHPSVRDGSSTKEQATKEFLATWDKARKDGTVDRGDFLSYYSDLSVGISEDDDFVFLLESTWGFEWSDPLIGEFDSMLSGVGPDDAAQPGSHLPDDPYAEDVKEIASLFKYPCTLESLITSMGASQISASPSISLVQFSMVLKKMGLPKNRCAELSDSLSQSMVPKGTTIVEVVKVLNLFEQRYGGGGNDGSIIDQVKTKLLKRAGSDGLRAVGRVMKMMDDDGSRTLSKNELKNGLSDWGLDLNYSEVDGLFSFFDRDNSGSISFDEFLKGLRGPMSDRRKKLVEMAFRVVDKTGDGEVTVQDLKGVYDCSQHPDVVSGDFTEDDILARFVDTWDQGEKDGVVTLEEFMDYYADVGASIDGDDYFELMIRNAWHIGGGEGEFENSTNLRVLCLFKDKTVSASNQPNRTKTNCSRGVGNLRLFG